ncbi:hypothetical protein ABK040_006331 [Willaertia magna]
MNKQIVYYLAVLLVLLPFCFSQTLTITTNQLTLHSGDVITFSSSNLAASGTGIIGNITFLITALSGGTFELFNGATYVPTLSFTETQIQNGLVRFTHDHDVFPPNYLVQAVATNAATPFSTPNITFSAWAAGFNVGAPQPIITLSTDGLGNVTFNVRMFKRNLDAPLQTFFQLGFVAPNGCTTSNNVAAFNFSNVNEASYYVDFASTQTLQNLFSAPWVTPSPMGSSFDLNMDLYSTYMTTDPSTGNCNQVIYRQRIILTLSFNIVRTEFDNTGEDAFLKATKVFVNDNNQLQIDLRVFLVSAGSVVPNSWSVAGPRNFTVATLPAPTFVGTVNGTQEWRLSILNGPVSAGLDFWGDYSLNFNVLTGSNTSPRILPFGLQYIVPAIIFTQLRYSTTATMYTNPNFSNGNGIVQFNPNSNAYVRVTTNSAVPKNYKMALYSLYVCCLRGTTAPTAAQCLDPAQVDYAFTIVNTTQVINPNFNYTTIPNQAQDSYQFSINLSPLSDTSDLKCALQIESYWNGPITRRLRMLRQAIQGRVETDTMYRVFDIIYKNNGGTKQTSNIKNNSNRTIYSVWIGLVALIVCLLL